MIIVLSGLVIPDHSPEPSQDQIEGCLRIGADESINDDEGLDEEKIRKRDEAKEAQHSAQVSGSGSMDKLICCDERNFKEVYVG